MEPVTKEQLEAILADVLDHVRAGDSFEGFLNYLIPEPDDPPGTDFRVEARYRIGNLDGHGGMRMIGVDVREG